MKEALSSATKCLAAVGLALTLSGEASAKSTPDQSIAQMGQAEMINACTQHHFLAALRNDTRIEMKLMPDGMVRPVPVDHREFATPEVFFSYVGEMRKRAHQMCAAGHSPQRPPASAR